MKKVIVIILVIISVVTLVRCGVNANNGSSIQIETVSLTKNGGLFSDTFEGTLEIECYNNSLITNKLQAKNFTINATNMGQSYFGSEITLDGTTEVIFDKHAEKTVFLKFKIAVAGMSAGAVITFYYNSNKIRTYVY